MSSSEDAVALARDLQERQAASHFPTFATRGAGRRERPSLANLQQPPEIDDELRAMLDSQVVEEGVDHQQSAESTLPPPDDDNGDGLLEMDYPPPAEPKPEAELSTSLGKQSQTSGRSRRRKGSDAHSQASESSSHRRRTTTTEPPSPVKRRPSHRSEASAQSLSKKRMTVLMEGEMPEDGAQTDSDECYSDEDEDEDEDEERLSPDEKDNGADDKSTRSGLSGPSTPVTNGKQRSGPDSSTEPASRKSYLDRASESKFSKEDGLAEETESEHEESEDEEGTEEDEDEDEDEEDEDEEEVEPSLKYSRLKGGASDVLAKDTASAFAISSRFIALGTHGGMVYILDFEGNLVKGFRSHSASILDLDIDSTSEFVASASMDGLVSISALSTSEQYSFDFKRPMRCIALEPNFGRKSTRAFVCGGMAGALVQREKSWFGHKEVVLHAGEGPIWTTKWRNNLIAWANDRGIRIYDTNTHQRISFISAPTSNVRADLYRCCLFWQDDRTLLISWADHIKVAKVREKKGAQPSATPLGNLGSQHPQLFVEITAIFQLDCMISGIAPYGLDYLVLAYITEEVYEGDDATIEENRDAQRRREALRPELRIISRSGEELSSDVLSLNSFSRFQCNDYLLIPSEEARVYSAALMANKRVRSDPESSSYYVISPKDIVVSRPRDERDHVEWLLERRKYEAALVKVEAMGKKAAKEYGFDAEEIGKKYLHWLVDDERFEQAAKVASKILGRNVQAWEDWIFLFVEKGKLGTAIPYIPTSDPTLSGVVYDMILAHFLQHDPHTLLNTIKEWPPEIYSTQAVVLAIEDRLSREKSSTILMECLAELFIKNRQPSKALPYFLRLRRPNVFDLIRENNLFTAVQDQALLLIEFDEDLRARQADNEKGEKRQAKGVQPKHGSAIELLVDHTHSIPIGRVIKQLEGHHRFLYMYLDALFDRDPQQVVSFSDLQVKLYAEYEYDRLMAYLRAMSSFYSFEKAFNVCQEHDYVPEMVFLLGRVGDNKRALSLIIERLGDVERAIDFAKEQNDDDLWEDLLRYSESKPAFIRGLLENVGAEIDPIRLIRRIRNGLEIPGLKPALIKILHDFSLQVSLLEGCDAILSHDNQILLNDLQRSQDYAHYLDGESICATCEATLFSGPLVDTFTAVRTPSKTIVFLCGHAHHLTCLLPAANIPAIKERVEGGGGQVRTTTTQAFASSPSVRQRWGAPSDAVVGYGPARRADEVAQAFEARIKYEARLRVALRRGCPVCLRDQMKANEYAI